MPAAALALFALLSACTGTRSVTDTVAVTSADTVRPAAGIALDAVQLVSGLASPTWIGAPPSPSWTGLPDHRIFVAERAGRIRVIENGVLRPEPFLDITALVSTGGERGLQAVAFHPRFESNGRLFVYYTDRSGDITVERYTATADSAITGSRTLVIRVDAPFSNHVGGGLAFIPAARTPNCRTGSFCPPVLRSHALLIGLGDGGSAGDPLGHAQNPMALLGKVLRLDVDVTTGAPYGIPSGNPFTVPGAAKGRPEVWATGVQDVAGIFADTASGVLYVADASSTVQEVNVAPIAAPGINYGWNVAQGEECVQAGCSLTGLSAPALAYGPTPVRPACGIGGGVVYNGDRIPALNGKYVFADRCAEGLSAFRFANLSGTPGVLTWGRHTMESAVPAALATRYVAAVGLDGEGEPLVATDDGRVFRLTGR